MGSYKSDSCCALRGWANEKSLYTVRCCLYQEYLQVGSINVILLQTVLMVENNLQYLNRDGDGARSAARVGDLGCGEDLGRWVVRA